jgi:hypothetical protein
MRCRVDDPENKVLWNASAREAGSRVCELRCGVRAGARTGRGGLSTVTLALPLYFR